MNKSNVRKSKQKKRMKSKSKGGETSGIVASLQGGKNKTEGCSETSTQAGYQKL